MTTISIAPLANTNEGQSSLVDPLIRLLMNSRRLDSGYRTARPILTYRGPVPESLAFASHEVLTFSSLAASFAWRRRSTAPPPAKTCLFSGALFGRSGGGAGGAPTRGRTAGCLIIRVHY